MPYNLLKKYNELLDELTALQEQLKMDLTQEQYELVDKLHDKLSEILSIDAEEYYKYGLASGIMLMVEINQFLKEQEK